MADRLSGEKRALGVNAEEREKAQKKAKKVLDDEKKRTEQTAKKFCEAMLEYCERWDRRGGEVAAARPEDLPIPNQIALVTPPAEQNENGTAKSAPQQIIEFEEAPLLEQLSLAEADAREMNEVLSDIEMWITLRQTKIVREGCFGTKLQHSTLGGISKMRSMCVASMGCLSTYYKAKAGYETSVIRYKYPASYGLHWVETVRLAWLEMEHFYKAMYHKTMLLYIWLRDREDKLRNPKTDSVL
eukprot:TRINITY_DN13672_c0_g1_i2.p1 TRINITY_DN13672_c0_g1~~TRINITY_DN13672_c0_g1_i2.p1  ORF type:complete len:243 (+),score=102.74 TRINITY_DN13672_c0_g1_i2:64-792(+)